MSMYIGPNGKTWIACVSIPVAEKFSKHPVGRFRSVGPFSGEAFREDVLIPVLKTPSSMSIDFSGVRGCGSSFLEEAFGGLVRVGFDVETLRRKLRFSDQDDLSVDCSKRAWRFIEEEAERLARSRA